jgi:hypothetical protein
MGKHSPTKYYLGVLEYAWMYGDDSLYEIHKECLNVFEDYGPTMTQQEVFNLGAAYSCQDLNGVIYNLERGILL